jgi:cytochrome c peroxidase
MQGIGRVSCLAALCSFTSILAGCEGRITSSDPPQPTLDAQLRQSIGNWGVVPIGAVQAQDSALVRLGQALFFDPILSGNRDISCATCHHPSTSLGDGLALSIGTGGKGLGPARTLGSGRAFVPRHAPSLINSGIGNQYLFWDGRLTGHGPTFFLESPVSATDSVRVILPPELPGVLAAQAMLPVVTRSEMLGNPGDVDVFGNPNELAMFGAGEEAEIWSGIMKRLIAIPEYASMFAVAFPGTPVNQFGFDDAARALVAFQVDAFTMTRSPFDRYLDRDDAALTVEQKRGGLLFFGRGLCSTCHNGPFLGGQTFANTGIPQLGPGGPSRPPLDLGRAELINNDFYRFAFRAPPLRNVELTSPYMHNGAYSTLEAVVRHYDNVPLALRTYDVDRHAPALHAMHHAGEATIRDVLETLDGRLRTPLHLSDQEMRELVAFLKSMTDPAARDLRALVPSRVPSGLPIAN